MISTDLTSGRVPGGVRFAAWLDGNDGSILVEFWALGGGGSILRREYDRRTTRCVESFVAVDRWEFRECQRSFQAFMGEQSWVDLFKPLRLSGGDSLPMFGG
jgi:hypothetical protein